MLNGLGTPIESVLSFIQHFKQRNVITLDVPGVGESTCLSNPYRMGGMARIIKQTLEVCGIEQVDVLGISWGGALAQQFARDFPDTCNRLVLAATTPGLVTVPMPFSLLFSTKNLDKAFAAQEGGSQKPLQFVEEQLTLIGHVFSGLAAEKRKGIIYQLLALYGWTSFFWLPKLKSPTLVLMGKHDCVTPAVNAKIFRMRLDDVDIKILPGDHLFLKSSSMQSANLINQYLNNKGGRS